MKNRNIQIQDDPQIPSIINIKKAKPWHIILKLCKRDLKKKKENIGTTGENIIDHMLDYKTSVNTYKWIEII